MLVMALELFSSGAIALVMVLVGNLWESGIIWVLLNLAVDHLKASAGFHY